MVVQEDVCEKAAKKREKAKITLSKRYQKERSVVLGGGQVRRVVEETGGKKRPHVVRLCPHLCSTG